MINDNPQTTGCSPGEVLLGIATSQPRPGNNGWYNTCSPVPSSALAFTCYANGTGASAATCSAQGTELACQSQNGCEWAAAGSGMGFPCYATAGNAPASCTTAFSQTACQAIAGCNWAPSGGFNVGTALTNGNAGSATDSYLRIRMEFDPSTPGDTVAPYLSSWNLDVDCVPSE
jgi:hypothetical protein